MSSSLNFIDIHGHINFPEFDVDREATIVRAGEIGVGMISVGTNIESSKRAVELSEKNKNMWATVGIHPTEISEKMKEEIDWVSLRELAMHPKVVAIGECGLDYFHMNTTDMASQISVQKEIFERQITLANEVNKPLMLHVRNAQTKAVAHGLPNDSDTSHANNAYRDALVILKKSAKVRANFHFFAGSLEDLRDVIAAGYTVSFTGVISFTSDYDELIRYVPVDRIMSETDCPFVAPKPHRGKRNEPAYVVEVVKSIARIRGEDESAVARQILANATDFFGLCVG